MIRLHFHFVITAYGNVQRVQFPVLAILQQRIETRSEPTHHSVEFVRYTA